LSPSSFAPDNPDNSQRALNQQFDQEKFFSNCLPGKKIIAFGMINTHKTSKQIKGIEIVKKYKITKQKLHRFKEDYDRR